MWRSLIVVVLLHSLLAAQAPQTQAPHNAPVHPRWNSAALGGPRPPEYRSYTFHDGIRRGRTERVAIHISPWAFVTTPLSPVAGITPLHLELQPEQGFTVGKLRYPRARMQAVHFQPGAAPFATTGLIQFDLKTAPDASLGMHTLKGRLTFQPVDLKSGAGSVQQMEIEVPINVVEHDAKVTQNRWPFHHIPTAQLVVLIVLAVPIAVIILPFYLICLAAGKGTCND